MRAEPVLEVENVTVRFGGVTALDNVSLSLRTGDLHCLIGPNGAGKSTFFRAVAGVQKIDEGRIWVEGCDIAGFAPHDVARLGVGVKTQVPSLLDGLSVLENAWIAARRTRTSAAADRVAESMLELVGVSGEARRTVGQLAHGRRQLVEFAVVLAAGPRILLLDEPAAGLTTVEVEEFAKRLREVRQQMAVLVVEHNMEFVRMLAETVTMLHRGRVLVAGSPETVFADENVRAVYLGKAIRS